jgi:hypothetical protein
MAPRRWLFGWRVKTGVRFPPICDIAYIADRLAGPRFLDQIRSMNLDDQIRRYFGTSNLAAVPPEALDAGIEHMKVDLGLSKDRGERFALWALLHTLGSAPDLDAAFESEAEREAARNFMDLLQGESRA